MSPAVPSSTTFVVANDILFLSGFLLTRFECYRSSVFCFFWPTLILRPLSKLSLFANKITSN